MSEIPSYSEIFFGPLGENETKIDRVAFVTVFGPLAALANTLGAIDNRIPGGPKDFTGEELRESSIEAAETDESVLWLEHPSADQLLAMGAPINSYVDREF